MRDADDIVREMRHYTEHYRVDSFDFCDLTFILNRRKILEFCRAVEPLQTKWTFPAGSRSECIDEEVLVALRQAGLRRMYYAPETGSPTTAKRIKKRLISVICGVRCGRLFAPAFPRRHR